MLSRFGNRSILAGKTIAVVPTAVTAATRIAQKTKIVPSTAASVRMMHSGVTATTSATAASSVSAAAASTAASSSGASASGAGAVPRVILGNLNPAVVAAEYAVRGEIVIRADQYRQHLEQQKTDPNLKKLPFDEIISCNIGNPQELGQQPITFFRQVLALCQYPALLESKAARALFAGDAIARARHYLQQIKGGMGAYSSSQGVAVVRNEVAQFIKARDGGIESNADDIFLTDGASSGVKMIINKLVRNEKDGIMIPIPQYPLYSATLTLNGGAQCGYYLDEKNGWGLQRSELERSLKEAKEKGITVRGLVVINPGNPTGQVLSAENMREIVSFCASNGIVLLADEVYQTNIYGATPFTSFKKVVAEQKAAVELVSFHSVSKGFLGECGQRGGYMELYNYDAAVKGQVLKLASISLCSNITGQIVCGLMVNPPKSGDESYAQYVSERDAILSSLKRRAVLLAERLNAVPGITCNAVAGAMYAFPQIALPKSFIAAAAEQKKAPDLLYCSRLLDETGIVVVPGSGFKQQPGTHHLRTTILPSEAVMGKLLDRFAAFHKKFLAEYK